MVPEFSRERFDALFAKFGTRAPKGAYERLAALYGEAGRFYHTEHHVAECLRALQRTSHLAQNPDEVALAIWYHDAVYDSRRSDNEAESAALAERDLAQAGFAEVTVQRVREMILATQTHDASGEDAQLMMDIDLGILGQAPEVFERYDAAIRKEYEWVPADQYRAGRARVLRSFLKRDRIYNSDEYFEQLEAQARSNLEKKIGELG